ncbi:MAG: phosphate ABC transporter substrate-binding protein PstS family protein [Chloroflexi bacterium]|nr:phosphate ABC transporter substrate-binding protein PstS family protein [Chloroflexota bacterium]
MLKSRLVILVLLVLLAIPLFGAQAQEAGTIAEVAAQAGNFTTLLAAVEAAGLTETLGSEGPFTVFAPTDEAFAAVPAPVIAYLLAHPAELTRVLTYHVVAGNVMSTDLAGMVDENGQVTAESLDMANPLTVTVSDMGVMVNDATVTAADIVASNGVIHVIDRVLIPDFADMIPAIDPLSVEGDIITAGSSTVFPLTEAVANRFVAEGYTGNITIDSIGTGAGFERFCASGESDISNASRAIRQAEIDACAALATPRVPIPFRVGIDALTVVVSAENDFVTELTLEQLAQVFSTAETWADVDPSWPAEPIIRYIPGTDSGTFDFFVEEVFEDDSAPILAASNLNLSEDDNVLVQGVESSPYAVGFFGYAYFQAEGDRLTGIALDGVQPTAQTAENGSYPLSRPLFIYSDAGVMAAKPQVAAFVGYYISVVNEVIGEVGYFPVSEYAMNRTELWWVATSGMSAMGGM